MPRLKGSTNKTAPATVAAGLKKDIAALKTLNQQLGEKLFDAHDRFMVMARRDNNAELAYETGQLAAFLYSNGFKPAEGPRAQAVTSVFTDEAGGEQ